MAKITVQTAADRLGVSAQALRVMIQKGIIGKCWGPKCRRTYYITDEMITEFKQGG